MEKAAPNRLRFAAQREQNTRNRERKATKKNANTAIALRHRRDRTEWKSLIS